MSVTPTAVPAARATAVSAARVRSAVISTAKYASLVIAGLVTLVPLTAVFVTSLKTDQEAGTGSPFALPTSPHWQNYATAFIKGHMLLGFANTAFILAFSVVITVLIGSMSAYAIDRFDFAGKSVAKGLFTLAALVPGVTTSVATFQIINWLGLFNTRWAGVALFSGTDIVSIYIFLQFIRSIPRRLDEAARIDGASSWAIYWRIIFPLLRPAIATVVVVKGIAIYNEFYTPFLYMPSKDLAVISTALFNFKGPYGSQWEIISAGVIIVIVPSLLVFLFLQRYIYAGMSAGASK